MSDCIERTKALSSGLCTGLNCFKCTFYDAINGKCKSAEFIKGIPAADVQPVKHGRWIDDWDIGCSNCSVCGKAYLWEDHDGVADWNFCPNCGAKMDGEVPE